MTDTLGYTRLDARTIARLAQAVERRLNTVIRGQTPESYLINRNNQTEYMRGLDMSGVPLNIIAGVAEESNGVLDLDATTLIVRIAIRFGMQLQRAIEASTRTSHPGPQNTDIQTQEALRSGEIVAEEDGVR